MRAFFRRQVAPARDNVGSMAVLRLLFWLRVLATVSQSLVIAVVHFALGVPLPLAPLAITVSSLAIWNVVTFPHTRNDRAVSNTEVAINLAFDIAAFTSVLYFTGGSRNPFVSLYLVPVSLAAISLPARYAWSTGALCGAGYTTLLWLNVPLPAVANRFGGVFDLHVAGMWVNFLVAAVLIILLIGYMARQVRQRDQELATAREMSLRDQQIIELGTLAAGTAHELNTPLSTLALLTEELMEIVDDDKQQTQLRVMMEEIGNINTRLNRIAVGVGAGRSEGAYYTSLGRFLEKVVDHWALLHPEIDLARNIQLPAEELQIVAEATIEQAIRNVLDNAAHASSQNDRSHVELSVSCADSELQIRVSDEGIGLDPSIRDEIGFKMVSSKDDGLGIGLLLSRAALQRFGGGLRLGNRPAGGTEARIRLPLHELIADARQ